jgi:putative ABC transport system permease protein
MTWWPHRTRDRLERELDAELRDHLERLIVDYLASGMPAGEARRKARLEFGGLDQMKDACRDTRGIRLVDEAMQDLRYAARSLTKYPIACGVAVVSLAGGIGATAATLTIRDVVFSRPPALYRAPEQLSQIQVGPADRPIMPVGSPVNGRLYAIWRDAALQSTMAASAPERVREVRTTDRVATVPIRSVTRDFFSVLGVDAILGHTFSGWTGPADRATPAVLSYRLWQTLLEQRHDALGATLWIENQPYVVVGVMPEPFWFSSMDSPVWTPLDADALSSESGLEVIVRRDHGVTPERLAQQLQGGLTEYTRRLPAADRPQRLKVSGLEGTPLGHNVAVALPWVLGAAVLLTLLIACANVAILVIAQWTAREHEIAIRASLGASRGRIVRALVTESMLIAVVGGLLGICATLALRGLMIHRAGPAVRFFDLSIDPRVLIEAALITLLSGLASGIGPALLETRRLHGNPMRTMSSSDRVRQRWRHALVVLEIGVTVALLVVTGSMLDLYARNLTVDVGFRTHPLLSLRVENGGGVPTAQILDALTKLPGVAAAAASTTVPYVAFAPLARVSTDAVGSQSVRAERGSIDHDFFATLDVPMRAGRAFTRQDSATTRTAIVNETLARRLFSQYDPIGQRVWIGETSYEIVGMVTDYKNAQLQAHDWDPKLFLPLPGGHSQVTQMDFLVRATGNPAAIVRALRRAIPDAAAGNVVSHAFTFDELIALGGQEILVGTAPLVPLIATGMLLTAAGIYGVLAFSIARRSKELAVRAAIGASGRDLVRLVTAHSLRLLAVGTACGVGGTFALSRVARAAGGGGGGMLDPSWPSFVIPVAIILGIGALATWVPSRRVLRLNLAVLLRST